MEDRREGGFSMVDGRAVPTRGSEGRS